MNAMLGGLKFCLEDPNFFIYLKPDEITMFNSRSNAAWERMFSLSKQTQAEQKRLIILILYKSELQIDCNWSHKKL